MCVYENLIPKVLERTSPLARRISFEVCNSFSLPEDAYQEMQIEQIKVIRKVEEGKTFEDLVFICLSRLKLYRLYSFREGARVKDKSSTSSDVYELQDYIASPFMHPAEKIEEDDIIRRIYAHLRLADVKYSGVLRFFEEAVNPSNEILDEVEKYKSASSCPRGLASGDRVPPAVLAKVMGVSSRRLFTYKMVIGKAIVRSGIKRSYVNSFFDFGETTELAGIW
jgi:hypothetical protein